MTYTKFELPLYHYDVIFIYITEDDMNNVRDNGKHELQNKMREFTTSKTIIDVVMEDVEKRTYDGAITFHSISDHRLFTFFYPMFSVSRAKECAIHELYHLTSDIVNKCNLDEEAGAYIQEYIGMQLFDFVHTKIEGQ